MQFEVASAREQARLIALLSSDFQLEPFLFAQKRHPRLLMISRSDRSRASSTGLESMSDECLNQTSPLLPELSWKAKEMIESQTAVLRFDRALPTIGCFCVESLNVVMNSYNRLLGGALWAIRRYGVGSQYCTDSSTQRGRNQ